MANDHAKDRYDPPALGSDWDKDYFGDVNIGEVFRLRTDNKAKSFRQVKDGVAFDLVERAKVQVIPRQTKNCKF